MRFEFVTHRGEVMVIVHDMGVYPMWEGVVWHHPDGRMAKLKARDV